MGMRMASSSSPRLRTRGRLVLRTSAAARASSGRSLTSRDSSCLAIVIALSSCVWASSHGSLLHAQAPGRAACSAAEEAEDFVLDVGHDFWVVPVVVGVLGV